MKLNENGILLGKYYAKHHNLYDTSDYFQEQFSNGDVCAPDKSHRRAHVAFKCCSFRVDRTYIESVVESLPCEYNFSICTPFACDRPIWRRRQSPKKWSNGTAHEEEYRKKMAEEVKEMFYHAYDSYMTYAYPLGNLLPITCDGAPFELGELPMLTLIDTLDTLVILGDKVEFRKAVALVTRNVDFNVNVKVSIFEVTIRVLGGLLSAHHFAIDEKLGLYRDVKYNNELLYLAVDLADRLLPAFKTKTGIPYGTINLKHGVPKGETTVASTAGAGSLTIEFTMLSVLTGNSKYEKAARNAVRQIYKYRSPIGLIGKHIDADTGLWTEDMSGVGSNSDSFYEYLLKMYVLYNDQESWNMFVVLYNAVQTHNKHGPWYVDVSMWDACPMRVRFENLAAFWPGMETLMGNRYNAATTVNAYLNIWKRNQFIPEEYDLLRWEVRKDGAAKYPLRPELIESVYYMQQASKDSSWLQAGELFVSSLQQHSRTNCGYATIGNVDTLSKVDDMPSYFLAETCKYLFLLFDQDNFMHAGPSKSRQNYVFTTEAHPLPITKQTINYFKSENEKIKFKRAHNATCVVEPYWRALSYKQSISLLPVILRRDCQVEQQNTLLNHMNNFVKNQAKSTMADFDMHQVESGGYIITHTTTKDFIRVSGVGSAVVLIESGNTKLTQLPRVDLYFSDTKTSIKLIIASVVVREDGSEVLYSIPCSNAMFGPMRYLANMKVPFKGTVEWASPVDGCAELKGDFNGKIVIVERGNCLFYVKSMNAQAAGAVGVVVVNNVQDNSVIQMAGIDSVMDAQDGEDAPQDAVKIPTVMVAMGAKKYLNYVVASNNALFIMKGNENSKYSTTSGRIPTITGSRIHLEIYFKSQRWGLECLKTKDEGNSQYLWSVSLLLGKK